MIDIDVLIEHLSQVRLSCGLEQSQVTRLPLTNNMADLGAGWGWAVEDVPK